MNRLTFSQLGSPRDAGEYMLPGGIAITITRDHIAKAQKYGDRAVFWCKRIMKGATLIQYEVILVQGLS